MIRVTSLSHSRDGWRLHVTDQVRWRYLLDSLHGITCRLTRGWLCPLCLCGRLDWTYSIGWGPRDQYDLKARSLGSWLFDLGQWDPMKGSVEVWAGPVTAEEAAKINPEFAAEMNDLKDEANA